MAFIEGVFAKTGQQVRFWDSFGPRDNAHTWSQAEIEALLAGKTIAFTAVSGKSGNKYTARGYLGEGERGFGFVMDFNAHVDPGCDFSEDEVPQSFCGVRLTDEQRVALEAGQRVHLNNCHSKRTGNDFDCDVAWEEDGENPGHHRLVPHFDD